jgi:hypothetical protein
MSSRSKKRSAPTLPVSRLNAGRNSVCRGGAGSGLQAETEALGGWQENDHCRHSRTGPGPGPGRSAPRKPLARISHTASGETVLGLAAIIFEGGFSAVVHHSRVYSALGFPRCPPGHSGRRFRSEFDRLSARLRRAFPREKHFKLYLRSVGSGHPSQAGAAARRLAWTWANKLAQG